MSKGAQRVRPTKLTRTIKNHIYTPSRQTPKRNHLKSSQWTSSQNSPRQEDTTRSSQSPTTTVPKRHCSSPATKQSPVKESQSCTYDTHTLTTDSPRS